MRYPLLILIATGLAAAQPGDAAARSIKDCEKIQAADAYNQCLASFGPVAHEHELRPVPVGLGSGRYHKRRHHYYAHYRHRHRGRKAIELSVAPSGAQD